MEQAVADRRFGDNFVNGNPEGRKDGSSAVFPQGSHSLCLPDLFQALLTEPSHNALGVPVCNVTAVLVAHKLKFSLLM